MANVNSPMGLIPIKHGNGGVARTNAYEIATALASNIYRGSAVKPVGTNKRIDVAAAGDRLIGVFQQVIYQDSNGDVQVRPRWASATALKTGTTAEAIVFDDPFTIFQVQVSSATGLVAADVGAQADLVIGTGDASSGQSRDMLDQTTITSTVATGGQLVIEELQKIAGNDYGQYAKALVRIQEHFKFGSTTAGQADTAY